MLFSFTAGKEWISIIICGSSAPKLINSIRKSAFRQASNSNQRGDDLAEKLTDDAATFSCHKELHTPDHTQRYLKRTKESDNPDSSGRSSERLRSSTEGLL